MNIGAMDKLCIIEHQTEGPQDQNTGYVPIIWQEYTRLYGDFRPISSQEILKAQAINSETNSRLITHFVEGIDSTMRVRIYGLSSGPELFAIDGVIRDNKTNRQHLTFELREPEVGWE